MNHKRLQDFLRNHRMASQFAFKAKNDYLLARFGMINALWSSFEMATQAVEKILKAYILFTNRGINGNSKKLKDEIRKLNGKQQTNQHDIEAYLNISAMHVEKSLLNKIQRINLYYNLRYPDNNSNIAPMSTFEVNDLDSVIFEIWDNFRCIDEDYYYVSGISAPLYSNMMQPESTSHFEWIALSTANKALAIREPTLRNEILKRLHR